MLQFAFQNEYFYQLAAVNFLDFESRDPFSNPNNPSAKQRLKWKTFQDN